MKPLVSVSAVLLATGVASSALADDRAPSDSPPSDRSSGEPFASGDDLGPRAIPKDAMLAPKRAAELGVEGGYTQPFGSIDALRSVTHIAHAGGAIGLTYAYRISPRFSFGVTGQYEQSAPDGTLGLDASVSGVAAGVVGTYHFRPYSKLDPYASLGTGYRFLFASSLDASEMLHGFEVARLTAGLDVRISRDVAFGPMLGGDVNVFVWDSGADGATTTVTSPRPTTFLFAGLGGRFDLGGVRVPARSSVASWPALEHVARPAAGPPIARPVKPVDTESPTAPEVSFDASLPAVCHVDSSQVFFSVGSVTLEANALDALDEVSKCLTTGPLGGRTITIVGHADSHGSDRFNRSIAERRADSVAKFLRSRGVDPGRMTVTARVSKEDDESDPSDASFERRVDLDLGQ